MEIQRSSSGRNGSFVVKHGGDTLAQMNYKVAGRKKMVITHTEVSDAYKGTGLGEELVKAGVTYARKHNLTLLPLCPYAKSIIDKTPEYRDVLA